MVVAKIFLTICVFASLIGTALTQTAAENASEVTATNMLDSKYYVYGQLYLIEQDLDQSNSSYNLNTNNDLKTKDPNNFAQSINSTIEARTYQSVKAIEHQMEEELGLNRDSTTLIVLCVCIAGAICMMVYLISIILLGTNEITYSSYKGTIIKNRDILFKKAIQVIKSGNYGSLDHEMKLKDALHIIIQEAQWEISMTPEFRERSQNLNLNKLLSELSTKLANGILEEDFSSWNTPSLVIDESNPFALK